jgi:hypothetical protein
MMSWVGSLTVAYSFENRCNNTQKLRLGLFNEKKQEEVVLLESTDDIFNYGERLKATALSYGLSQDSGTNE